MPIATRRNADVFDVLASCIAEAAHLPRPTARRRSKHSATPREIGTLPRESTQPANRRAQGMPLSGGANLPTPSPYRTRTVSNTVRIAATTPFVSGCRTTTHPSPS